MNTITEMTVQLETLESKIETVKHADRSAMTSSEKGQNTRTLKALMAERDDLEEVNTTACEAAEIEVEGDDDSEILIQMATAAFELAIEADRLQGSYTGKLVELAIECVTKECFDAILAATYAEFEEKGVAVPGAVRNAKSIIGWAADAGELVDEKGEARGINQIKKRKSDLKDGGEKSGNKGIKVETITTDNPDLLEALSDIAKLN